MSVETAALILAWVAIVILAFAVAGLLARVATLGRRTQEPMLGRESASIIGEKLPDEVLRTNVISYGGMGVVILFADAACVACQRVLPEFRELARTEARSYIVAYRGSIDSVEDDDPEIRTLGGQDDLFRLLRVRLTPHVAVVEDGIVVASAVVGSPAELRALVSGSPRREPHGLDAR